MLEFSLLLAVLSFSSVCVLRVTFELCLSVYFLPAILRSSSALLLYSVSYLCVLAIAAFLLNLCTQPPYFRGGRPVGDATPFCLICLEEDNGTFDFFVRSSRVSSVCWDSCLYLLTFCS